MTLVIKEDSIAMAAKVDSTISEFGESQGEEYFEERIRGKDSLVLVAYEDGKPAGYLVGYDRDSDSSFYCWMAGVSPMFRRRGILKALMERMEAWAKQKGYKRIKVKTRNSRREMLSYLIGYGYMFTLVEEKEEISENRLHLEKSL
jgi:ribosomal protein S18 acetylase RimI-like enzyme